MATPTWSTMLARVADEGTPDPLESERLAVLRAQAGDREVMGKLLVRHGPVLYRSVLLPRLGSEAAAKDALAETYAKAIERIGQFRWQGVGVYPWLRVVALRVALDMLRTRTRVVVWEADDVAREIERAEGETPSHAEAADHRLSAMRDERAARTKVDAALERIHPRYATAIRTRLLDERPREDAAKLLGVTPATFDVLLHRAIAALKKQLHEEGRTAEGERG